MKRISFILLFLIPIVLWAHGMVMVNAERSLGFGLLIGIAVIVAAVPRVWKNKEIDDITKRVIIGAICVGALLLLPLLLLFVFVFM